MLQNAVVYLCLLHFSIRGSQPKTTKERKILAMVNATQILEQIAWEIYVMDSVYIFTYKQCDLYYATSSLLHYFLYCLVSIIET